MTDALVAWTRGLRSFSASEYTEAIREMTEDDHRNFCDAALRDAVIGTAASRVNALPTIKRHRKEAAMEDLADAVSSGYIFARYVLGTFEDRPSYSGDRADIDRNRALIVDQTENEPPELVTGPLTPDAERTLNAIAQEDVPLSHGLKDLGKQGATALIFSGLITGIQLALAEANVFLPPRVSSSPDLDSTHDTERFAPNVAPELARDFAWDIDGLLPTGARLAGVAVAAGHQPFEATARQDHSGLDPQHLERFTTWLAEVLPGVGYVSAEVGIDDHEAVRLWRITKSGVTDVHGPSARTVIQRYPHLVRTQDQVDQIT